MVQAVVLQARRGIPDQRQRKRRQRGRGRGVHPPQGLLPPPHEKHLLGAPGPFRNGNFEI